MQGMVTGVMNILTGTEYEEIKQLFIMSFTRNTSTCDEHYNYFWEQLIEYNRKSERFCWDYLSSKNNIYIMWDTLDNFEFKNDKYWKYPRYSIVCATSKELYDKRDTFPEDIYIFDASLEWTIIFTHEHLDKNKRYCLAIV